MHSLPFTRKRVESIIDEKRDLTFSLVHPICAPCLWKCKSVVRKRRDPNDATKREHKLCRMYEEVQTSRLERRESCSGSFCFAICLSVYLLMDPNPISLDYGTHVKSWIQIILSTAYLDLDSSYPLDPHYIVQIYERVIRTHFHHTGKCLFRRRASVSMHIRRRKGNWGRERVDSTSKS